MRLCLGFAVCLLWFMVAGGVLADPADLTNGVFIAHAPSGFQYTSDPPGGSWCAAYAQNYAITSCEQQDNEIDSQDMAVWYVLSAWTESKEWCGTQFGFGDYDAGNFSIMGHGACFPSGGLTIPSSGWPGPNEGIALTTTDENWSGNFEPVYWIAGYAYGEDLIPLGPDPDGDFAGWARCGDQLEAEAVALGGMGLLTDGIYVCPEDSLGDSGGTSSDAVVSDETVDGGDLAGGDSDPVVVCCVGECCWVLTAEECANLGGAVHEEYPDCDGNPCRTWHPDGDLIVVSPDGSGDYSTIQDAACAAYDGDIIVLEDGTFTGPGNRNLDFVGKAVTLRSMSDRPEQCIIDCEGSDSNGDTPQRGFTFVGSYTSATTVKGITVFDGKAGGPT
jgi:hypothetical protein